MVVIHDLKTSQLGGIASQHVLSALDHVEVSGALCSGSRVEHTLEGELNILTGQLGAVGEMHALL